MAKELPYFKFIPQDWTNGDITLCSFEAQGLFINLICLYWAKDCTISLAKAKQRFNNSQLFDELLENEIFYVEDGNIVIDFLDEQMEKFVSVSETRSKAGRKGGKAKAKQKLTKKKPIANIEEKRREEKIKEDIFVISSHQSEEFKTEFNHYIQMRKDIKAKMTDRAIELAIKKLNEYDEQTAIKMLENSIANSWKGLFEIKGKEAVSSFDMDTAEGRLAALKAQGLL